MITKQREAITFKRPARGVTKNFYVEFEGKDFPQVSDMLISLGWARMHEFKTDTFFQVNFFAPNGTALFGGHTKTEKAKYTKQFKKVLRDCGIEEYYEETFDWRDML